MAKGIKASARQKAVGKKNLMKASVSRIGRRGTHYKPKQGG